MTDDAGTVTLWQSGRLVPLADTSDRRFTREHLLLAALGVLCVLVLAVYVAVLEREVARAALAHAAQRAPAPAVSLASTRP